MVEYAARVQTASLQAHVMVSDDLISFTKCQLSEELFFLNCWPIKSTLCSLLSYVPYSLHDHVIKVDKKIGLVLITVSN